MRTHVQIQAAVRPVGPTTPPAFSLLPCQGTPLIVQRSVAAPTAVPSVLPRVTEVLQSPGRPLDPALHTLLESQFDFGRVHTYPPTSDTQLAVSRPEDPCEQEADRVAATGRAAPEPQRPSCSPAPASAAGTGHDFSQVRIYTDVRADAAAREVNARAYTLGSNIVFATGAYAPHTTAGRRLLAHELTHVMQQRATGRQLATIQRQQLDTTAAERFSTSKGDFYRFAAPKNHTNQRQRPKFQHAQSALVPYSGAGARGTERIHPAVSTALNKLMSDLQAEGTRLNDESMKQAVVANAYRPPTQEEGARYLEALQKTLRQNTKIFGALTFPSSMEALAQSDLGFSGSAAHKAFVAALAKEPGWDQQLAQQLVNITGNYKAPRGGSTHHSGVVVDINFPYATSESDKDIQWHGIDRNRNANALRAAAGVWLAAHAPAHGFDTYDTEKEIWHQEWLQWAKTPADPTYVAPPAPVASPAPVGEAAVPETAEEAARAEEAGSAALPTPGPVDAGPAPVAPRLAPETPTARVRLVLAALDPPADFSHAFHLLNGSSMPDILNALLAMERRGTLSMLWKNFDLATDVDRPRLSVAMRAVQLKGLPGAFDVLRSDVEIAVALSGLPADQKADIERFLAGSSRRR